MIILEKDINKKLEYVKEVLEDLKDGWFEIDDARERYIMDSQKYPVFVEVEEGECCGFVMLRPVNKFVMELHVCGVKQACHRHGIGSLIYKVAENYFKENGYKFIYIKTVKEGIYPEYDKTNKFYQKNGFVILDDFPEIWDNLNPCVVYIKSI